jgi:hypothetical protein
MLATFANVAFIVVGVVLFAGLFLLAGRPFVGWSKTFRSRRPPGPLGDPVLDPDEGFRPPSDEGDPPEAPS